MNKEFYDQLRLICQNNKNVCISVDDFIGLLKITAFEGYEMPEFDPISDVVVLKTGLYAKIGETNCYVSKIACKKLGVVRVAKVENPKLPLVSDNASILEENWSEEILLSEYGK